MNLEPTDEQRALRDTVHRFLAERASVAEHVRPMLDDPTGSTAQVWQGLADLGATGVLIPAEYGGTGMSMVDAAVVAEEVGAALLPDPWLWSSVAAPRAITRFGAESEAAELLTAIADGTLIATVALDGLLHATTSASGDVLSGDLIGVADAAAADVILAVVGHGESAALYLVETSAPEVSIERLRGVDGTRKEFRVALDDTPVRLLGTATRCALTALIDDVVVASAADALGAAQRLLDTAVEYAKTRTQFGQPIGSFQSVAHLCVDMYETVELFRSGVIHAAWSADVADAEERHLAALRLKGFAARLASVGDTAIQVLGGIGFTWEHDAHLYLKRLLSWSTLRGGSDSYLEEVGAQFVRSVLDAPRVGSET
jgi:alkylation response protein AidB-like acyl-CoA dehydrogenase